MGIEISWRSQAGKRTEDNRDCAGVGIRGDEALCIVLDGSTAGPDSGALARRVARALIDWFTASDDAATAESLVARLRTIHAGTSGHHPRASASYMIVHIRLPDALLAIHAGDCLIGRRDEQHVIEWVCRPHTLANAIGADVPIAAIAGQAARHRLTRSFRVREFMAPDAVALHGGREIIVATDGFWADLSAEDHSRFLESQNIPMPIDGDDRSALRLRVIDTAPEILVRSEGADPDEFYVKARVTRSAPEAGEDATLSRT